MAELSLCCLWRSMGGKLASQTHRWSKAQSAHPRTHRHTDTHTHTLQNFEFLVHRWSSSLLSPPLFSSKCLSANLVIEWELQKCLSKLRLYCHVSWPRTNKFWPPSMCGKSAMLFTFCMWTYGEGAEHEYAHTHAQGEHMKALSQSLDDTVTLCCQAGFFACLYYINLFFSAERRDVPVDTIIRELKYI